MEQGDFEKREPYFNISLWAFWVFIIAAIFPLIGDLCVFHIINVCGNGISLTPPWAEVILEIGYVAIALHFFASWKAYLTTPYKYMTIPTTMLALAGMFAIIASMDQGLKPIDSDVVRWIRFTLISVVVLFWVVEPSLRKKKASA